MKMGEKHPIGNIFPIVRYGVHRRTEKGWKIDTRTIADHELVLIEKGRGLIVIEGKSYAAGPGMLFYFYPDLVHSLKTDDDEPFSFLAFHFSYAFPEKDDECWTFLPPVPKLPLPPVQKMHNHRLLAESMTRLIEYLNGLLPGRELMVRAMFQTCIYHILRNNSKSSLNYSAQVKIDAIANYINTNIDKVFTSAELAALVKVTPDYISRLFRQYTGYSLIDYIHHCKIERAKSYLVEENFKVKEIAQQLGFSDEFHFSRVFKKVEGICPSRFKPFTSGGK